MNIEDIKTRNFTFVTAVYNYKEETKLFNGELTHLSFIVGTPFVKEAKERAYQFATEKWGQRPEIVHLYPRNYVREARSLFAQGLIG